jgi:DNA repair exonuclease SbcCD ATPase subunit
MDPVKATKDTVEDRPTESISAGKDALIALALALGLSQKIAAVVVGVFAFSPFLVSWIVDLRKRAKHR